ncbi:dienelactone hydrolase family protein [Pseudactinotalea sp. HY158]|uniref:dienelactone hydrolase family protein n=1 Tax=Pseudactinotalea sp. HY158 TaxID=2654547 RepID=UPI00129CDE3A|nr:dienelactone hydrolase family protein [Pseudactinotalea sp. HY158]QGH68518.1 hypothetical protein GCE65_02585 [Pseudactinotalea sp. HY158]
MNREAAATEQDPPHYRGLGSYSDWPAAVTSARRRAGDPHESTSGALLDVLAFDGIVDALSVTEHGTWNGDGIDGVELSWSVGYGPRTRAWLLKPSGSTEQLPGVVALHCHSHIKYYGKEKIATGPLTPGANEPRIWQEFYGGRPWADALARQGFMVLVHDVFMWGSRRFDSSTFPSELVRRVTGHPDVSRGDGALTADMYDRCAVDHELVLGKYANLLSTSLAGMVASEDRLAAAYLSSRPDVLPGGVGCLGFSGGGARAAYLASQPFIKATGIVSMMSTYDDLLDDLVAPHTQIMFPPGLSRTYDWPQVAASAAPKPLLVQAGEADEMFTAAGVRTSVSIIRATYERARSPSRFSASLHDAGHCFNRDMQDEAFNWMQAQW